MCEKNCFYYELTKAYWQNKGNIMHLHVKKSLVGLTQGQGLN
jgi:hypothetical protein